MNIAWPRIAGRVRPYYAGARPGSASHVERSSTEPSDRPIAVDPQTLVRSAAASQGWTLLEGPENWDIVIPIDSERQQTVVVRFDRQDRDGHDMICFSTTCGPVQEKLTLALLRHNTRMVHTAFAVDDGPEGEMVVMQANQLAETANRPEVIQLISTVARRADRVEKQLLGEDRY